MAIITLPSDQLEALQCIWMKKAVPELLSGTWKDDYRCAVFKKRIIFCDSYQEKRAFGNGQILKAIKIRVKLNINQA